MTGWQWNGTRFAPCATVPIEDRGFRYGMSVFETVAVMGGKPRFLAEHLDSLKQGLEVWNRWRQKYQGLAESELRRLKELEQENKRLKKIVAQQALDIDSLKELLGKEL